MKADSFFAAVAESLHATEDKWEIEWHDRVNSTQTVARDRPAGTAVIADQQVAGRGQAERAFVSDPGGLYLTAVLPYAGDALKARGFALAVGWAVRSVLRRAGATELRLRWPNDLMVGSLKVGGILVEQGGPNTLLVGIGLNLTNRPWLTEPALAGVAGRLADSVAVAAGPGWPNRGALVDELLAAVSRAHRSFGRDALAGLAFRLNDCWGASREVVIEAVAGGEAEETRGWFHSIDAAGRVVLRERDGGIVAIPAHHIGRLREAAGA